MKREYTVMNLNSVVGKGGPLVEVVMLPREEAFKAAEPEAGGIMGLIPDLKGMMSAATNKPVVQPTRIYVTIEEHQSLGLNIGMKVLLDVTMTGFDV